MHGAASRQARRRASLVAITSTTLGQASKTTNKTTKSKSSLKGLTKSSASSTKSKSSIKSTTSTKSLSQQTASTAPTTTTLTKKSASERSGEESAKNVAAHAIYPHTGPGPSTSGINRKNIIAVCDSKGTYVTVASETGQLRNVVCQSASGKSEGDLQIISSTSGERSRFSTLNSLDPKSLKHMNLSRRPSVTVSNTSLQCLENDNSSSSTSPSLSNFKLNISSNSLNPGLTPSSSSHSLHRGIGSHLSSPTCTPNLTLAHTKKSVSYISHQGSIFQAKHEINSLSPPTTSSGNIANMNFSSSKTGILLEEDEEGENSGATSCEDHSNDLKSSHQINGDLLSRKRIGSSGSLRENESSKKARAEAKVAIGSRRSLNGFESNVILKCVQTSGSIDKEQSYRYSNYSSSVHKLYNDEHINLCNEDKEYHMPGKKLPTTSFDRTATTDSYSKNIPKRVMRRKKFKSNFEAFRSFIEEDNDEDSIHGSDQEVGETTAYENETETTWKTAEPIESDTEKQDGETNRPSHHYDFASVDGSEECPSGGSTRRLVRINAPSTKTRKRHYPSLTMEPIPTRGSMRRRKAVTLGDNKTCAIVQSNMKQGLSDM